MGCFQTSWHLPHIFSSPDPKGHVSFCHHEASVVVVHRLSLSSSIVRRRSSLTFHILIFSSETIGTIWTKPGRHGPWVVFFKSCIRRPRPPIKMATMAKKNLEKSWKIFCSETTWPVVTKHWWNGPWVLPFQDCIRWPNRQPRPPISADIVLT